MVMTRVKEGPLRLIGFKSESQIKNNVPFKVSKKMYGYSAVLLILLSLMSFLLIRRTPIETTVLRASGTLYQFREKDHTVSNLYTAELVNKSGKDIRFELAADDRRLKIQYVQKQR